MSVTVKLKHKSHLPKYFYSTVCSHVL